MSIPSTPQMYAQEVISLREENAGLREKNKILKQGNRRLCEEAKELRARARRRAETIRSLLPQHPPEKISANDPPASSWGVLRDALDHDDEQEPFSAPSPGLRRRVKDGWARLVTRIADALGQEQYR